MYNKTNTDKIKEGLFKFGYVANWRDEVYIKELEELVDETVVDLTAQDIKERAENAEILYLNWNGYQVDGNGVDVKEEDAYFKAFDSGYTTPLGEPIYGWFEKNKEKGTFSGVTWGTLKVLRAYRFLRSKPHMGDIYFDNKDAFEDFLEDIASHTIPESWDFNKKQSGIIHPILVSYLNNIYLKLKRENKIIRSEDGKYIMFNTNLLDIFSQALYIIAEVKVVEGLEIYVYPKRTSEESYKTQGKYGFGGKDPEAPVFFDDINEVVFNTGWQIDKEFDSLSHIIEKRIYRFPVYWQTKSKDVLARKLKNAIDFAVAIAKRNYKYIVPIYYPKIDSISFLMPIYLDGEYTESPDFALVLQTDRENKLYIAKTILDLEEGYKDARLIAKPDESWFNLARLVKK